jgi:hypothetical protein
MADIAYEYYAIKINYSIQNNVIVSVLLFPIASYSTIRSLIIVRVSVKTSVISVLPDRFITLFFKEPRCGLNRNSRPVSTETFTMERRWATVPIVGRLRNFAALTSLLYDVGANLG